LESLHPFKVEQLEMAAIENLNKITVIHKIAGSGLNHYTLKKNCIVPITMLESP